MRNNRVRCHLRPLFSDVGVVGAWVAALLKSHHFEAVLSWVCPPTGSIGTSSEKDLRSAPSAKHDIQGAPGRSHNTFQAQQHAVHRWTTSHHLQNQTLRLLAFCSLPCGDEGARTVLESKESTSRFPVEIQGQVIHGQEQCCPLQQIPYSCSLKID